MEGMSTPETWEPPCLGSPEWSSSLLTHLVFPACAAIGASPWDSQGSESVPQLSNQKDLVSNPSSATHKLCHLRKVAHLSESQHPPV